MGLETHMVNKAINLMKDLIKKYKQYDTFNKSEQIMWKPNTGRFRIELSKKWKDIFDTRITNQIL